MTLTRALRPSSGSGVRSTSPDWVSTRSVRVAVGRFTRSISASSLGVSGPCRSTVASAAAEVGVSRPAAPAASCRSRRAVRTIASRSLAAEAVGDMSAVASDI